MVSEPRDDVPEGERGQRGEWIFDAQSPIPRFLYDRLIEECGAARDYLITPVLFLSTTTPSTPARETGVC